MFNLLIFPNNLLCFDDLQINKALELMEQLRQRMGVVIVGPSGSGKSTLWKILRLALTKLGQSVKQYIMNPKAMPRTQVRTNITRSVETGLACACIQFTLRVIYVHA